MVKVWVAALIPADSFTLYEDTLSEGDVLSAAHLISDGMHIDRVNSFRIIADTRPEALDWIDEKIAAKKREVIKTYEGGMKAVRELEKRAEELRNE